MCCGLTPRRFAEAPFSFSPLPPEKRKDDVACMPLLVVQDYPGMSQRVSSRLAISAGGRAVGLSVVVVRKLEAFLEDVAGIAKKRVPPFRMFEPR